MAISQSAFLAGQKPIREITKADFRALEDSDPLELLPPGLENTAEAQQGLATHVKVFVLDLGHTEAILDLINKLLLFPTIAKIAVALPELNVRFIQAVSQAVPNHVKFGVCDYDAAQLQTLIDNKIRISFCSINADACCALPQDILALSRDMGIQLIAHHDPPTLPQDLGAAVSRSISLYEKRQVVACTTYHSVV